MQRKLTSIKDIKILDGHFNMVKKDPGDYEKYIAAYRQSCSQLNR